MTAARFVVASRLFAGSARTRSFGASFLLVAAAFVVSVGSRRDNENAA